MSQLIIYGRGLIAEEYCRHLERQGRGKDIIAFAVTRLGSQAATYCRRPCLEIGEALERFPQAEVHLALQEKYHGEVLALLAQKGRKPTEIIGLHRMTELLGEQGIEEIRRACPELTVQRNPHDYSMLEISSKECPGAKFTFYPMTQVPLSAQDVVNLQRTLREGGYPGSEDKCQSLPLEGKVSAPRLTDEVLYIAMATSSEDAKVSRETLPAYVHPVLGGAAAYEGPRFRESAYDDEPEGNISRYNNLYSELTVAHWLWQKSPKARYLGLCHYRRHFLLPEKAQRAMADGTVDVFLPRPRLTFPSVRAFFTELHVSHMEELDYRIMLELLEKRDEELAAFAREFLSRQVQFPNNMVIAKREIYLAYCKFLFSLLQDIHSYYGERQIKRPDRYLGNVGEMLTTVYFAYHRDKWLAEYLDYQLLE